MRYCPSLPPPPPRPLGRWQLKEEVIAKFFVCPSEESVNYRVEFCSAWLTKTALASTESVISTLTLCRRPSKSCRKHASITAAVTSGTFSFISLYLMCICCILCVFVVSYVYLLYLMCICVSYVYLLYFYVYLLYFVCIDILTLVAGLLARSPATGHLGTGLSWFPCVYKRMLRWFPSFQVATTCFSCSPPDLNFLVTFFYICVRVK